MNNPGLLKRLTKLGFPLLESEEAVDVNATLAEVVKSKDARLWEGLAVVLANSAEQGLFNYESLRGQLKAAAAARRLNSLLAMSLALYRMLGLKFSWAKKLTDSLTPQARKEFNDFQEKLKRGATFMVAGKEMSAQRLQATFNNYSRQKQNGLSELLSLKEEFGLEYALSQVFSPKQKELFLKKLKGEKLNKTEKEYFSRAVKKKVLALADPQLHRLSRRLLQGQ